MTTRMLAALAVLAACGGSAVRRFPARDPLWRDPDMTPYAPRPSKYTAPEIWDTIDNTVLGPLVEVLAVERVGRARNVNAVDEVPDSSWFQNRIERIRDDIGAIARGACTDPVPDPAGPWTVTGGKPDGANPGFFVEHASGQRFLLKPDGGSGERQSAADIIGTRLYHAAGYYTACTRVAYIDPAHLRIAPTATAKDFVGDSTPFTRAMLDAALAQALRDGSGRIRAGLSQLIEGKVIGPWVDFGTRPDDPNDVIPHEDRRELRGSYVLAALLGHYDQREQNSLDSWITTSKKGEPETGYVRHYMFDFGDCLGSRSAWGRVTRRRGHAYEIDWPVAFVELFTLGALPRPWRERADAGDATLGYFAAEPFAPDRYRTAYPFGPFTRLTEADAAWGARILAQLGPDAIRAVIAEARLSDPGVVAALERALLGRREALLRRYLGKLSPLTRPRIDAAGRLCVSDARRDAGLLAGPPALTVRALAGTAGAIAAGAGEHCVALPAGAAMPPYTVVELTVDRTAPLRVHLYASGGRYRVAGVDRVD